MPSGFVEGALVVGWSAHVIDVLLSRYGPKYLVAMTSEQRAEIEHAHAAIHRAAELGRSAASGNTAMPEGEPGSDSAHDELTIDQVAQRLGVERRQARNLAAEWAEQDLARKVGGVWLVDAVAVEQERHRRRAA